MKLRDERRNTDKSHVSVVAKSVIIGFFTLVLMAWGRLVWLPVLLVSTGSCRGAMSCILSKSSSGEVSSQPPL